MINKYVKRKLRIQTRITSLGLLKKYNPTSITMPNKNTLTKNAVKLTYYQFTKIYTPLLSVFYIFDFTRFWVVNNLPCLNIPIRKNLCYYAKFHKSIVYKSTNLNYFNTLSVNNAIIFSKPKKQLFIMFFKNQPIFIFTGGLMRIVMNEKKKSSKKLFKVAVSLIKLTAILLIKKQYFSTCYLKLHNIGLLKLKILKTFSKLKGFSKILYVFNSTVFNITAQKFNTRRSIKKYVRKRFKIV